MVKFVRIAKYYFQLLRWPNLLVIALTQSMMRWFVLKPLLGGAQFLLQLELLYFLFLVIATVAISAAGYVINDYFDRKTDFINRPHRVIVGKIIPRRVAMLMHLLLSALGVLLGFYISYALNLLHLGIIFLVVSGALWFYSTTYKNQLIIGNVIIAALVALVPLMVLLFELPLIVRKYPLHIIADTLDIRSMSLWVGGYTVFAFLTNLMREVIKDIEDFEGDYVFGRKSIPIVWGTKTAKIVTTVINASIIAATIVIMVKITMPVLAAIYATLAIVVPLGILQYRLFKAKEAKHYHQVSVMLKLVMVLGLGFCVVYHYL
ncbi:MAG: geranylgeranylglycerol-phosphate geranylgeranyltransferase [Bacteroidales bacterium]|nr:geranylgeranylglycerol-phosphate geranylgeranyltransferase [Bacteroidales bacterium]